MRIAHTPNLSRTIAPLLALAGIAWSTPAFAGWERAYGYALKPGERCPSNDTPKLRASDGRAFRIPAGFKGEIEIYGHGIDLNGSAEISGHSDWAGKARSVGGAENTARGCGSIGSLVVRFDIPSETPAGNFTLRFGNETMAIQIVKPAITRTIWSPQTMQGSLAAPAGGGGGGPAASSGPVTSTNNGTGCQPNGAGCSGSSGAVLLDASRSGTRGGPSGPPNLDKGVGGCIREIGGNAAINGTILTLDLPPGRGDAVEIPCLTRPMFLNVELQDEYRGDVGGFRAGTPYFYPDPGSAVAPPSYGGNREGLTGPTVLAAPNRDYQQLRLTEDFARTHVGERRLVFTPPAGSGASTMTLVIRSNPGNGVQNVVGLPFTGPRTSSNIEVKIDFYMPPGGARFHWRLRPLAGSNPAACFTATSGSLTASSAIASFQLTAREAAGCAGTRFNLDIGPERDGAAVFQAPYARIIAFVLPERSAPTLTPGSIRPPLGN
jgi:hypothetical protein